ncbi:LytTR family DNA-binding domain-containing protein [Pullulanibacillus pueri]|nr:LytTR family DNA-binding domain-containing protein [Pullulanibacillus pueri]
MKSLGIETLMDSIGELLAEETSLVLSNTEEYLYYRPSKRIDLKIKPGDPVLDGSITFKALQQKQKISEYIDRDIFGVPYYGMSVPYPVGDPSQEIQGVLTAVFPTLTSALSVVTIKVNDGWMPLAFKKLLYIEAKDRRTYVVGQEVTGTHKFTLNEFDFLLPKEAFIRCHRSFIVNVNYIQTIYPDTHSTFVLKMQDGTLIPVSQSYSSYFRKVLGF